ncbi:MAG: hypothetical protein OXG67_10540 [bacterium]|nr:hypothetical protein [bacterium]MCY3889490.1 hypothetical protein [bacterium]
MADEKTEAVWRAMRLVESVLPGSDCEPLKEQNDPHSGGGQRTPDFRAILPDGEVKTVEETSWPGDTKNLRSVENKIFCKNKLRFLWTVVLQQYQPTEERNTSGAVEFCPYCGKTHKNVPSQRLKCLAERVLLPAAKKFESEFAEFEAGVDGSVEHKIGEWQRDASTKIRRHVAEIERRRLPHNEFNRFELLIAKLSLSGSSGSGIKVSVMPSYGFQADSIEKLVEDWQSAIEKKADRDQGADWLVVSVQLPQACSQLEEMFRVASHTHRRVEENELNLDLCGFEEVWTYAKTFHGDGCVAVRFRNSSDWQSWVLPTHLVWPPDVNPMANLILPFVKEC